ncbi:hypothetical protein [Neisseria sp. 27098_8_112]|uniref:hypothetical protein n=1 Tax=unclassified Neisseria TaxID=2623750 RepID=UPI00352F6044
MISNFGATDAQVTTFLAAYEQANIRAAAHAAGIDIIQATMIARHSGVLRITEAAIVNSKAGETGRVGEEIFQDIFPDAVNANLAIRKNMPRYDFLLNGAKIDIKTTALSESGRGQQRKIRLRCDNKLETDIFVIFAKADQTADIKDKNAYRHVFIIPSLALINHRKIEILEDVLHGSGKAWSEYLYPIEKLKEKIEMLTAYPELLSIPDELKETVKANDKLKSTICKNRSRRNK